MTKTIDPESEDIIQRFTTFAHAFSDIKSLEFKDETIEEALVTGFLGSLPDSPDTSPTPQLKGHCVGWVIGIKDKPTGLSRSLGLTIYESYTDAAHVLRDTFTTPLGNQYRRPEWAPYTEKEDYEIVPIYR